MSDWNAKKESEGEVYVKPSLCTHGSHRSRNKGSQRPGTRVPIVGLHACYIELLDGSRTYM